MPRKIIQFLALSLIFIILPAGSWYYLNQGYNYRKAILDELDQNLGTIPPFQLKNQNGYVVDNTWVKGKVAIINFLSLTDTSTEQPMMQQMRRVQDQFDKRDDIVFLTYTEVPANAQLEQYVEQLALKRNKNQWHFLTGSESELLTINQSFPLQQGLVNNTTMAITDTSSVIRFVYDFKDEQAIKKLIEHIANLMPRDTKKRELRDTEK